MSRDAAEARRRGQELKRAGDLAGAEREWRRADEGGDACAATFLAQVLRQRGDLQDAELVAARAADRGDALGAVLLGSILRDRGEDAAAYAADRRADELGHAVGALSVGSWLQARGEREAALDAFRRADERGNAHGAFEVGKALYGRGDEDGAVEAWSRAAERGHDEQAAINAAWVLWARNDFAGAEALLRGADERGGAEAAYELGRLMQRLGRSEECQAAFGRARERGSVGIAKLVKRNLCSMTAERVVEALPTDARDLVSNELSPEHAKAITDLGQLMILMTGTDAEVRKQLEAAGELAVERGAPTDEENVSLVTYLSEHERDELALVVDRGLDSLRARTMLDAWIERSGATTVLAQIVGESMPPNEDEAIRELKAGLEELRQDLRQR